MKKTDEDKAIEQGIRDGDYYIDKGGYLQLTRKRKAEIHKMVLSSFREELVKIARRDSARIMSVIGKGNSFFEIIVTSIKMPVYYKTDRKLIVRDRFINAQHLFNFSSHLPNETQRELACLLSARFRKNKKLKHGILLKAKLLSQQTRRT